MTKATKGAPAPPTKKALNRIENKVDQIKAKQKKSKKSTRIVLAMPSISDKELSVGVHDSINSFFYPNMGIHRGQAKAFASTGLALLKGTQIFSNAVSASNIFAFAFLPALCNTSGWFYGGFGASVTAALAVASAAVITTTQSESFRVVSFQATVTPQGSFLNQAGSGLTGYIADNAGFAYTPSNISNLLINRPFKAVDTQIVHWLPSENAAQDETQFCSTGSSAFTTGSQIIGYLNIPTASDQVTTFQIDYQIGVEYAPSPAYRPFIDKLPPVQDIRTMAHVSAYAAANFDPLMVGCLPDYQARLATASYREGAKRNFEAMTHLGSAGIGLASLTGADIEAVTDNVGVVGHILRGEFGQALSHGKNAALKGDNLVRAVYNQAMPDALGMDVGYYDTVD